MGALLFDSTDTVKATSLAAALANVPTGAWTVAFLVKRTGTGTDFDAIGYLNSGTGDGTAQVGLSFRNDNKFMADVPGTGATSLTALASTSETYIVVISRPAGANQAQITSFYTKSTNTWVHDVASGSVSNGVAATMLELGAWQHTGDFLRGYVGLAGFWAAELTQAQKQELSANWRTSDWWNNSAGQPKALIQGNTATPTDLAGNATSWTYTGVTLDAGETLASFNFDGTGGGGGASGPSSATVHFTAQPAGRKTGQATAATTAHLQPAVTGRKTGQAPSGASLHLQTQASGGAIRGTSASALLHFTAAATGTKTGKAAGAASEHATTQATGFKTAIGTHEEASPNPPFTTLVEGAVARVAFTTAATGQQAALHAGPAAASLHFTATAAGSKTGRAPSTAAAHLATQPAGRKTGNSGCASTVRFGTQATGANTTPTAGAASAQLRLATSCSGRGARAGIAAASARFTGQPTGRKSANGAALAIVRHVTSPVGSKRTGAGCAAAVRLTAAATGEVGPPVIAAVYPPAPAGHIAPAPAGYVTR